MMSQTASVVSLSLIGGRLRKNSHEPSSRCFFTISSAIRPRLCFCPASSEGNDRAATAMNAVPIFTPLPMGRGSGGAAGSSNKPDEISFAGPPSVASTVSLTNFLSIA